MESENTATPSTSYYGITNPEMFGLNRNPYIPNQHPYMRSAILQSAYQQSLSDPTYKPKPFEHYQSPTNSFNPYIDSRFKWTQDTKPEFSFSSNTEPKGFLNSDFNKPLGNFGYKRKTKSPPTVPYKQHITEERMAEHMSRLHITSRTQLYPKEIEPVRQRRLYICDEMQRLQAESIIPIQILEKVQRPCTALIPWEPPILPASNKEKNNNEEDLENSVPSSNDYYLMETASYSNT